MEAEIKAQGAPGENLEQVKKQYDTLKVSSRIFTMKKLRTSKGAYCIKQ